MFFICQVNSKIEALKGEVVLGHVLDNNGPAFNGKRFPFLFKKNPHSHGSVLKAILVNTKSKKKN